MHTVVRLPHHCPCTSHKNLDTHLSWDSNTLVEVFLRMHKAFPPIGVFAPTRYFIADAKGSRRIKSILNLNTCHLHLSFCYPHLSAPPSLLLPSTTFQAQRITTMKTLKTQAGGMAINPAQLQLPGDVACHRRGCRALASQIYKLEGRKGNQRISLPLSSF